MRSMPAKLLESVTAGLAVVAWLAGHAASADAPSRPNILICVAEDQSWLDTGATGSRVVHTPAFDRIAREGALFQNAFTSSPCCTPSRGSLLTGRAFYRLEAGAQMWSSLPPKFPLLPYLLQDAGYRVGYTGKGWGPPDWDQIDLPRDPAGLRYDKRSCEPPASGMSKTDYAANFADFLGDVQPGQPFSFWYGSQEAHRGYQAGSGARAGKSPTDVQVPPFLPDAPAVRSDLLDYALEIDWCDTHLARMIGLLEERGLLENTIVIVTSDNGMPFPRAKGHLYDAGVRMPFAVRWGSRVPGGRVVTDFICFPDVAPTLLDAAGLKPPAEMDGRSFLSVLLSDKAGRVDPGRDHVIVGRERFHPASPSYPCRGLRTDGFLYIRNFEPTRPPSGVAPWYFGCEPGPTRAFMLQPGASDDIKRLTALSFDLRPAEELYDLAEDPWQMRNVAGRPDRAEVKEQLASQLERELRETGDPRVLGTGAVFDEYPVLVWPQHRR